MEGSLEIVVHCHIALGRVTKREIDQRSFERANRAFDRSASAEGRYETLPIHPVGQFRLMAKAGRRPG